MNLRQKREYYENCLQDPYLVNKMEDHSMLYGLKEAEERLHFLLREDTPVQTFQEMNALQSFDMDLTSDLHQLLNRLHQSGLEVIVVDQTVPLIRKKWITLCKSHYSRHATDDVWTPSYSSYRTGPSVYCTDDTWIYR